MGEINKPKMNQVTFRKNKNGISSRNIVRNEEASSKFHAQINKRGTGSPTRFLRNSDFASARKINIRSQFETYTKEPFAKKIIFGKK